MMEYKKLNKDFLSTINKSRWTSMKQSNVTHDQDSSDTDIFCRTYKSTNNEDNLIEDSLADTVGPRIDFENKIETTTTVLATNTYREPEIIDLCDNFIMYTMKIFSLMSIFGKFSFKVISTPYSIIKDNRFITWMKNNPALIRIIFFIPEAIVELLLSLLMAAVMLTEPPRRRTNPTRYFSNVNWENEHLLKEPNSPISQMSKQVQEELVDTNNKFIDK